MSAYSDPNESIYLQECIPPSEYGNKYFWKNNGNFLQHFFLLDKSQLLLCRSDNLLSAKLTDSSALNEVMHSSPLCINSKDLQVYKGR